MGEVVAFRLRPAPVVKDDLAEIIDWIKPASDWWTGSMQIQLSYHAYMLADYRRVIIYREHGRHTDAGRAASELTDKARKAWLLAGLRQIFIPAEAVRHLRWKQNWLRQHGGGTPETALAIASDEASLVDRLQAVARQQAGRRKAVRG
ncbi:hypothetical protein [Mesorhizobium sp. RIZ17]|uniref:hypothetical protein n=1 Tax=Mesorhizobium sp. RIZ17 TaxID=3132743 RepID=UPI003DA8A24C